VRATQLLVLVGVVVVSASACQGPPVGENLDGGPQGQAGGSGGMGRGGGGGGGGGSTSGTGGSASGTGGSASGAGGSASGAGGSASGAGGAGGMNACSRCETPCTDGLCDLQVVHPEGGGSLGPTSVALDATSLYYAVGPGVEVRSIPKQGGPETILYPQNQDCSNCVLTVAVDDTSVYFGSMNAAQALVIMSVPKTGGPAKSIVSTVGYPGELVVDSTNVYWFRQDIGVQRAPKAGGGSPMTAATAMGIVLRMSLWGSSLAWGDRDTGVVTRIDTGTLGTRNLGVTTTTDQLDVYPIGVCDITNDGTSAYWILCGWPYTVYTEGTNNQPHMLAQALASGANGQVIFDEFGSIGVDGDYVYFTESGLLDRVPKAGGDVEARASIADSNGYSFEARIIGFDDKYVYLANNQTGSGLYRVVK
jgi:hypothetical protein